MPSAAILVLPLLLLLPFQAKEFGEAEVWTS
jgi:hypothetical protein